MTPSVNYSYVHQLAKLAADPAGELQIFQKIEHSYKFSSNASNFAAGITGVAGLIAYIFSQKIANRNLKPSIPLFILSGVCLLYSFHANKFESLEQAQSEQIDQFFNPLIEGLNHETEEKTNYIIQTIDQQPINSADDIKKFIESVLAIYEGKKHPNTRSEAQDFKRTMDQKNYDLVLQSAEQLEELQLGSLKTLVPEEAYLKLYRLQRAAHFFLVGDKSEQNDAYVKYSLVEGKASLVRGVRV